MNTGTITSGVGHVALILWLVLGDWLFSPPPAEDLTVMAVAPISEADFQALKAATAATPVPAEVPAAAPPEAPPVVEQPPVEQPPVEQPPEAPPPVEQPPVVEQPPPVEQPPVDAPPEVTPGPVAPDVDPSDLPAAVELQPLPSQSASIRPKPRPAERVSTDPVPSVEDVPTDVEPTPATAPAETPDPTPPEPPQDQAVQPDSGDVLTTEATEPQDQSLGMTSSPRPPRKPPVPAVTEVAADQPATEAAPAEQPAAEPTTDEAAINDALTAALADANADNGATDGGNTAPQGPPMTAGEKDGLRVAVEKCWNVGALSTEALRVTVTVNVDLDREGKPDKASIAMAGFEGGSAAAAKVAYEVARRAILKCGAKGFQLPPEKYEEWKELSLNFNPDGMRMR
jgi:hypothetical protein